MFCTVSTAAAEGSPTVCFAEAPPAIGACAAGDEQFRAPTGAALPVPAFLGPLPPTRPRSGPAREGASPRPRLACFGERLPGARELRERVRGGVEQFRARAVPPLPIRVAARDQDLPGGQRRRDRACAVLR